GRQRGGGPGGRGGPASAPTFPPGSSRPPLGCRRTSTSSPAASSGPSNSCKEAATSPWRRLPPVPASRIRASSLTTSSASSASRRDNSERPQQSPNKPQVSPRKVERPPLTIPYESSGAAW